VGLSRGDPGNTAGGRVKSSHGEIPEVRIPFENTTSPLLDRHEAKKLALEIAYESGIVADVWETRTVGTVTRRFYLVLRDAENTEIAHRHHWDQYKILHQCGGGEAVMTR
jgi:hypothetical protein